jgi:hypothetical protein
VLRLSPDEHRAAPLRSDGADGLSDVSRPPPSGPDTTATSIRKDASGAFTVTDAPLRRPRVSAPPTVTSKTEE